MIFSHIFNNRPTLYHQLRVNVKLETTRNCYFKPYFRWLRVAQKTPIKWLNKASYPRNLPRNYLPQLHFSLSLEREVTGDSN